MFKIDIQSQDKPIPAHKNEDECTRIDAKRHEMLILVDAGHLVEPPKKWFDKICLQVDREHPMYTIHQTHVVVMDMWNDMAKSTKIDVIQKYIRWDLN